MTPIEPTLILSAFVAGFLMFLAPCTLPLVPAYLAFIAGVKPDEALKKSARRKIVVNSLFYILGFSLIFIAFGVLAGLAGLFVGSIRNILVPLTGVLVIIFGLQMLHVFNLGSFFGNFRLRMPSIFRPGSPLSAFTIGAAFALGWTPCVGPILATILLLAGSSGTVLSGVFLLAVFSLGLAIPFFLCALLYASATQYIATHQRFIQYTEFIGGLFLILIGILLLTDQFELTIIYGYKIFEFFGIGDFLDYY